MTASIHLTGEGGGGGGGGGTGPLCPPPPSATAILVVDLSVRVSAYVIVHAIEMLR